MNKAIITGTEGEMIPTLRGGVMGIVSGMKGGAPAGALMGAVVMAITTADTPIRSLWLYAIVVGLTLGLMGGATFGAIYGFTSGLVTTPLLNKQAQIKSIWYGFAWAMFIPIIWLMLTPQIIPAVATGLICGAIMAYFAHREFMHVWQLQSEPEEGSALAEIDEGAAA